MISFSLAEFLFFWGVFSSWRSSQRSTLENANSRPRCVRVVTFPAAHVCGRAEPQRSGPSVGKTQSVTAPAQFADFSRQIISGFAPASANPPSVPLSLAYNYMPFI